MTMQLVTQTWVACRLALLGLPARLWSAGVVVLSTASVVGVLLSMLCVTEGLLRAYMTGADPGRVIVMPADSPSLLAGGLSASDTGTIMDAPGIGRGPDGKVLADPEILMWVPPARGYTIDSPLLLGTGAAGLGLRPGFRVISGRLYRAGQRELLIGVQAAHAFHIKVGDSVILPDGKWPIVGTFAAGGSILEGELVGDALTIMTANRMSGFGSVLVGLKTDAAFASFRQWLTSNPGLGVSAERQTDYYRRVATGYSAFFTRLAYAVGVVMALGALFGSVKIMYASVAARTREMATLRAMGYAPLPLALSVILESLVLALAGAALGVGLAWALFSARTIANFQNVFQTSVTPGLAALGFAWAGGLALLGGLLPAVRAARLSVTQALRAV